MSSVTVNSSPAPSAALTSPTVIWALSLSVMVPTPVSLSPTSGSEATRLRAKASLPSSTASFSVATVNCWNSPAVPAKFRSATTLS